LEYCGEKRKYLIDFFNDFHDHGKFPKFVDASFL